MKTAGGVSGGAHERVAPRTTVSYVRGTRQRIAILAPPLPFQQSAQLEALEQALLSSQQDAIAAQRQVDVVTKENAQLKRLAAQREQDVAGDTAPCAAPCATWNLTDFLLSAGLDAASMRQFERLLTRRIRLRKHDVLYRVGGGFSALYAIRSGSCKTVLLAPDGHDQVAGYHMAGEIIGMDGIGRDSHDCQAVALEDMEVCRVPFEEIENLARHTTRFRQNLDKLLMHESARARTLMIVLGTLRAEQRLAVFLLDLSQRYQTRGYSPYEFVLRMTRQEIGSYLGLQLETVSRLFSRFQREGLIQVQGRVVKLLDRVAVNRLVDSYA